MERLLLQASRASRASRAPLAPRLRVAHGAPPPPPAPPPASTADLIERTWAQRLRTVPFADYATHPLAHQAARALDPSGQLPPAQLFRRHGASAGPTLAHTLQAALALGSLPAIGCGADLAALGATPPSDLLLPVVLLLCGAAGPVLPDPALNAPPTPALVLDRLRRLCPAASPARAAPLAAARYVGAATTLLACMTDCDQPADFPTSPQTAAPPPRLGADLHVLAWNLAAGALFAGRAERSALQQALAEGEAHMLTALRSTCSWLSGTFYARFDGTPMRLAA